MRTQFVYKMGIVVRAVAMSLGLLSYLSLQCMDTAFAMKEVVLLHPDCYVDQHLLRNCAMINTTYNNLIEDNYRPEKKRIERWLKAEGMPIGQGFASWNKNFSSCAWLTTKNYEDRLVRHRKKLEMSLVCLVGRDVVLKTGEWDDYESPAIKGKDRPFFDEQGAACFYGYGLINSGSWIAEYCLTVEGYAAAFRCMIDMQKEDKLSCQSLAVLAGFPALLQAILYSMQIKNREIWVDENIDHVKIYTIDGVIIPDNYMNHDISSEKRSFRSIEDLPHRLKNLIVSRYAKQLHCG